MRVPGYNSPQRMTSYNRLLVSILALLILPSAHAVNSSSPQPVQHPNLPGVRWELPSVDLAKQIAALTGPGRLLEGTTCVQVVPMRISSHFWPRVVSPPLYEIVKSASKDR